MKILLEGWYPKKGADIETNVRVLDATKFVHTTKEIEEDDLLMMPGELLLGHKLCVPLFVFKIVNDKDDMNPFYIKSKRARELF